MEIASLAASLTTRLTPMLGDLDVHLRPSFLAVLERKAAERYDAWAAQAGSDTEATLLRACAERERTIASRIEPQFAIGAADAAAFEPLAAEAGRVYTAAFEGLARNEAFALQATLERAGAAAWRGFAAADTDAGRRDVFLECATLEEASADVLDRLGAPSRG